MSVYMVRGILSEFVHVMLNDYINNIQTFTEDIFREDSPCSYVVQLYLRYVCRGYVMRILEPFLMMLLEEQKDCEIFQPHLQGNGVREDENMKNLMFYCEVISSRVLSSAEDVPRRVIHLFAFMSNCMKNLVPNWERIKQVSISSFFFLRMWNFAITCPTAYGFSELYTRDPKVTRTCILLAKYLQTLASGATFQGKEEYMIPLMEVVEKNKKRMVSFLEFLSKIPEHSKTTSENNKNSKTKREKNRNTNSIQDLSPSVAHHNHTGTDNMQPQLPRQPELQDPNFTCSADITTNPSLHPEPPTTTSTETTRRVQEQLRERSQDQLPSQEQPQDQPQDQLRPQPQLHLQPQPQSQLLRQPQHLKRSRDDSDLSSFPPLPFGSVGKQSSCSDGESFRRFSGEVKDFKSRRGSSSEGFQFKIQRP
eukprot:TRINITY_DN16636_c0_g1_i1.p1 TRINITY_DN16636_c0_g1~~TRINITY_DN16636_c0_g1_i1.p1  ORF type:complete len:422 (+),score=79.63 TRINITY_DN16636_c0_g1_i1:110-1375(+)